MKFPLSVMQIQLGEQRCCFLVRTLFKRGKILASHPGRITACQFEPGFPRLHHNLRKSYHRSIAMENTAFRHPANGRILEIALALGGAVPVESRPAQKLSQKPASTHPTARTRNGIF